mgnify:CR=1 FL=1
MRIFGPFMRILSVRSMFPRQGVKNFTLLNMMKNVWKRGICHTAMDVFKRT